MILDIEPSQGSMLGGDIITISGMCSNQLGSGTTVSCLFDTITVTGVYLASNTATCVTPTMFRTGRIPLTITFVVGLSTHSFKGIFTMCMYNFLLYFVSLLRYVTYDFEFKVIPSCTDDVNPFT